MNSRERATLKFGVWILEYSNMKKRRREVGPLDWKGTKKKKLPSGIFSLSPDSSPGCVGEGSSYLQTRVDYWPPDMTP